MNPRSENERLQNDIKTEKQTNETMLKFQADVNQLNKLSQYRQKGKAGIGYIEEGESSKKGAQNNQRPT